MPDLERAADLIAHFAQIWDAASLAEQGRLVKTLRTGILIDQSEDREVLITIKPKQEFAALFEMAN